MPVTDQEISQLQRHAKQLRKDILDITFWAGGSHIGGALSMVEIMILLYYKYLNIDPKNPEMPDRDRVILSKGHAGVGFAPLLSRKGYFDFEQLKDFNKFNSPFGMHLDGLKVKGVDMLDLRWVPGSRASRGAYTASLAMASAMRDQFGKLPWQPLIIRLQI
jgi:transketolase